MKVGFLGAGNMGGAILRAIAGSASFETAVYEKSAERAQQAAQTAGCLVLELPARTAGCSEKWLIRSATETESGKISRERKIRRFLPPASHILRIKKGDEAI